MLLSEYRAKELARQYGIAVPDGRLAKSPEEAEERCRSIAATRYVVKAQIAAGGRGLAGGIRFAATPSLVAEEARRMLGSRLVTEQTGPEGEPVETVYVEAAQDIAEDFYIALALDPDSGAPLLLASAEGGVEFEKKARSNAELVQTCPLPGDATEARAALDGFLPGLGLGDGAAEAILAARRAFVENDMLLLEINPFARLASGEWMAVDAKAMLDGNALFRHPEFAALADGPGATGVERIAQDSNINLVTLDGDIGVVVNGAGLGLATNDMLVDAGGRPANFMDIRTTATSFDIAKGVELLLTDDSVKVILLNVHGGGMTVCDTVAEGVAFAYARAPSKKPVVARLAGQNADWGLRILKERRVPAETVATMTDGVRRAVALAGGAR